MSSAAPEVFATEAAFQPQYAGLNMQLINELMEGTPGGSFEVPTYTTEQGFRNRSTGAYSRVMPRNAGPFWEPHQRPIPGTRMMTRAAQPGLRETATGGILPRLTEEANYELGLGGMMNPAQMRQVMQGVRSRQSGMLSGTGSSGDFQEALGLSAYGNELRTQRRTFAGNVANQNMDLARIAATIAGGGGPRLMGNQFNAQDTWSTLLNQRASQQNATANSNSALAGAGISGAALLGAAALGL